MTVILYQWPFPSSVKVADFFFFLYYLWTIQREKEARAERTEVLMMGHLFHQTMLLKLEFITTCKNLNTVYSFPGSKRNCNVSLFSMRLLIFVSLKPSKKQNTPL